MGEKEKKKKKRSQKIGLKKAVERIRESYIQKDFLQGRLGDTEILDVILISLELLEERDQLLGDSGGQAKHQV